MSKEWSTNKTNTRLARLCDRDRANSSDSLSSYPYVLVLTLSPAGVVVVLK